MTDDDRRLTYENVVGGQIDESSCALLSDGSQNPSRGTDQTIGDLRKRVSMTTRSSSENDAYLERSDVDGNFTDFKDYLGVRVENVGDLVTEDDQESAEGTNDKQESQKSRQAHTC